MSVSDGDLDGLIGVVFATDVMQGLAITSLTTTSSGGATIVGTLAATSTGHTFSLALGDTGTVTAVDDSADTVSITFSIDGTPIPESFYVIGFSADSILLSSGFTSAQVAAAGQFASSALASLSTTVLTSGAPLDYDVDGSFTGTLPCFVAGTRIGDVAVEALNVGDTVAAMSAGRARVRWIGRRRIDCARHPDPSKVWPVRVRADAFGANVPCRDLLLSPDHAVFLDDVLVPIKRLVNGASIAQVQVDTVTYVHVELDRHDVIFAEGLPAESYLDDGNRAAFENGGMPLLLHPSFPQPEAAGRCAPLATANERIEPLWRRLAERAVTIGHGAFAPPAVTADAGLRLSIRGRVQAPVVVDARRWVFAVPPDAGEVRLRSRATAPAAIRPWLDDHRRLGVAVERIVFHGRFGRVECPVDHPGLGRGWHAPELAGSRLWRWTDGDAVLSVPAGSTMLEIGLTGAAAYLALADGEGDVARMVA
jgi:hypothetical protein